MGLIRGTRHHTIVVYNSQRAFYIQSPLEGLRPARRIHKIVNPRPVGTIQGWWQRPRTGAFCPGLKSFGGLQLCGRLRTDPAASAMLRLISLPIAQAVDHLLTDNRVCAAWVRTGDQLSPVLAGNSAPEFRLPRWTTAQGAPSSHTFFRRVWQRRQGCTLTSQVC